MVLKGQYISKIELVVLLIPSVSLMYQCFQGFPYVAHMLVPENPIFTPYLAMLLICGAWARLTVLTSCNSGNKSDMNTLNNLNTMVKATPSYRVRGQLVKPFFCLLRKGSSKPRGHPELARQCIGGVTPWGGSAVHRGLPTAVFYGKNFGLRDTKKLFNQ